MRRFVAFAAASVAAFSLVFITVSRNYEVVAESSPSEIERPAFQNYDIREAEAKAFLEKIPVSAADREAIAHGNAETLLGL